MTSSLPLSDPLTDVTRAAVDLILNLNVSAAVNPPWNSPDVLFLADLKPFLAGVPEQQSPPWSISCCECVCG